MCTCACRPSAAASRRRRASSGMNRTTASSTSRSTPVGRIRCANPATWSSTNPAAAGLRAIVARAIRRARHAARSPDSDPGPGLREPVPQLEGLTQVGLAGLGGQPDRGRELGHTELRDQRRTRSGDRDRLVPSPNSAAASPIDSAGCRSAQGAGGAEQVDLGGVGGGTAVPGEREHPGSGVRCGVEVGCRRGHGSILVELVFESSVESVDFPLREYRRSEGSPVRYVGGFETVAARPPQRPPAPPREQTPSLRGPPPVAALFDP